MRIHFFKKQNLMKPYHIDDINTDSNNWNSFSPLFTIYDQSNKCGFTTGIMICSLNVSSVNDLTVFIFIFDDS